ncbi:hypothetical protein CLOM_g2968 [Closterium sp. NIES-68]|nr:hypothetical protein CLOM_g2968 [Closterium sp. NIES-68]GJP73454.1 hypothetical protein CLOP_g4165 [Closterium sp. NIES-67]GJP78712.1 hypothetical protein CLOP_g8982 [Closterium sp. NIES-67]
MVYKYHSTAEDEVVFPALDSRVKNVAHAYTLEHKVESDLFDQLSDLVSNLRRDETMERSLFSQLICCTEALLTVLVQHLSKEEEQVFPLLVEHFDAVEQANLVWQFMCSMPIKLMEDCLPWMASYLTENEQEQMVEHMHKIVPQEELLQEVVSGWMSRMHGVFPKIHERWTGLMKPKLLGTKIAHQLAASGSSVAVHKAPKGSPRDSTAPGTRHPIDELLYWHNAIRKELEAFNREVKGLELNTFDNLTRRYRFLSDICVFHSTAEDQVVFPALSQRVDLPTRYVQAHANEEKLFAAVGHLLDEVRHVMEHSPSAAEPLLSELKQQALTIVESLDQHLQAEEDDVFPLLRQHCSLDEQRRLVYRCLLVMPLRLLERVLPWVMTFVTKEEATEIVENMKLAAPEMDVPLVSLFTSWASKHPPQSDDTTASQALDSSVFDIPRPFSTVKAGDHSVHSSASGGEAASGEVGSQRTAASPKDSVTTPPSKRARLLGGSFHSLPAILAKPEPPPPMQLSAPDPESLGSKALSFSSTAGRALTLSSATRGGFLTGGVLGPGIFSNDRGSSSSQRPIDAIFHFHQALRKDLEYLSAESARLATCDDDAARDFSGRFHFLWGLYRAHSNAEDEIVFPALEAKEALHNVSHSYTIDHKQEEELFDAIAGVLNQLSGVISLIKKAKAVAAKAEESGGEAEWQEARKQVKELEERRRELAERVHRMSLSVRLCLDQHISREELELWPLFGIHFSMEEQDAIVGRIIGTTGAEVLQAMLTWITAALSDDEQARMVDTWRNASRNTMFDQWLSAWWKSPAGSANPLPPSPGHQDHKDELADSLSSDALQMVAEYLESDGSRAADQWGAVAASRADDTGVGGAGCGEVAEGASLDRADTGREGCGAADCSVVPGGEAAGGGEGGGGSGGRGGGGGVGGSGEVGESGAQGKEVGKEVEKDKRTFRPGWHNIFRMNQKELEAAIRRVSNDSSLDPRRKAYLMQNLMTSRWIVAQQQQHKSSHDTPEEEVLCASYHDEEKGIFGCQHYRRNCKVRAVCCGKLVSCRFCHDKVADHAMDRHAVREMMCMKCLQVQPVGQHCATPSCNGYSMAKHYCSICKLFDDARDIYHCPFCNLCRVGRGLGIDYFHCMTCNACMSVTLATHKCREKGLESNCPICHDFLFTSSAPVKALPCGHFMHSACFQAYTCEHYTCPICCKSVGDMRVYFGMLDALLAAEQLPEEYRNRQQAILCNDCEAKGNASFHWLYHKCSACGSYNTRTI